MPEYDKASRYIVKKTRPASFAGCGGTWTPRYSSTPGWMRAGRPCRTRRPDVQHGRRLPLDRPSRAEPRLDRGVHGRVPQQYAGSLLAYVLRRGPSPQPPPAKSSRRRLGGVVINLTGPAQARAVKVAFPGVQQCNWSFGVLQRTLRKESAAKTLADIAAGRTTRWLLPWIPLLKRGGRWLSWKSGGDWR